MLGPDRCPEFQSTLPRVGRDWARSWAGSVVENFNPPSPCGEGLDPEGGSLEMIVFQSTLPVWGGTFGPYSIRIDESVFQSTLPVWGGTAKVHKNSFLFHALSTNSLAFFVTTSCFLGENQKTGGEFVKTSVRRSQGNPGRFPLAPI